MSETNGNGATSFFRLSKGVLTGREAIAIGGMLVVGVLAWAAVTNDVKGLGVRASAIEDTIKEITRKSNETHDTVIELRTHQRATGDQLNRIEAILDPRRPTPPARSP